MVRDVLGIAPVTILPTPAVRTPPHHTSGPGPFPCSGRDPASPRVPQGGMLSTSSRRPGPPLSRGPGPPRDSRTPLAHALALHPGGARDRHVPHYRWRTYICKTLACRARGTPPRHTWKTIRPTATTTPPVGAVRTPARSLQGRGRCPRRLPRPTPCPTVYFPQCSTTAPPRFGRRQRLPRSPVHVHRPSLCL